MRKIKKVLSVLLSVLMMISVFPIAFAAVEPEIISVGDIVTFGVFEQDNDLETNDPLEWVVVGKDGNALKLITKYIINTTISHAAKKGSSGVWGVASDTYSNFLPDFFEDGAFTEKETAAIIPTNNNAVGPEGPLGDDLVYIPSIADITSIFATDTERTSSNTAVAAKSSKKATPVGENAMYLLRDEAFKDPTKPLYYTSYVDATGAIHVASETDMEVSATAKYTVGIRLMTNIDLSKLYTTGKDAETGIIPLVGTLGSHKVIFQCKCIDAEGNEKKHTFTFLDANYQPMEYQIIDHGDSAIPPEENDIIVHRSNYHKGYEFVGWDQDYSSITSDMVITAVYEKIPEKTMLDQIIAFIKYVIDFVKSFIEKDIIPVIKEWLNANLGVEIGW